MRYYFFFFDETLLELCPEISCLMKNFLYPFFPFPFFFFYTSFSSSSSKLSPIETSAVSGRCSVPTNQST